MRNIVLNVQYRKKTLVIDKKTLNFDYEVGNAFCVDDNIIFLLKIPYDKDTLKNIYCMSKDCQFLWQVQSVLDSYPELNVELPFEGMTKRSNGNISAYDFYGRNFEIDSNNGKFLGYKIVK